LNYRPVNNEQKSLKNRFDDQYIFLEPIGKGGTAKVFKAFQKTTNNYVALKLCFSPNLLMVENENDILNKIQKLNNDRFLKYYGMFVHKEKKGMQLLSMEYGVANLAQILKSGKIYTSEELSWVMQSLVESFKILEDNGICHRDVKPDNIILVKKENSYEYKLSDFGISYLFSENSKNNNMISSKDILGFTESFVAPEILEILKNKLEGHKKLYDAFAADVFSLGVVFLLMTKTKKPYDLRKEINSEIFNMEGYKPKLKKIIVRMLSQNPENRISFKGILEELSDPEIIKRCPNNEYEDIMKLEKEKEKKEKNPKKMFKKKLSKFALYYFDLSLEKDYLQVIGELQQIIENNSKAFENTEEKAIFLTLKAKTQENNNQREDFYLNSLKIYQNLCQETDLNFVTILEEFPKKNNYLLKSLNICLYMGKKAAALKALFLLGYLYLSEENSIKTERYFSKLFKNFRENYPEYEFHFSMENLEMSFEKLGELTNLEKHFLSQKENLFGYTDASISAILYILGKHYENIEKYDQAAKFYQKSFEMRNTVLGIHNCFTQLAYQKYVKCKKEHEVRLEFWRIEKLRRNNGCLEYLEESQLLCQENDLNFVAILEEFPKKKNYLIKSLNICLHQGKKGATLKAVFLLGYLHLSLGNKCKTERYFSKFFKFGQELFPEYDFNSFNFSMNNLEMSFENLEELTNLEKYLLTEKEISFGYDYGFLSVILFKMGEHFEKLEDYSQASKFYQKSFKMRNDVFGKYNLHTKNSNNKYLDCEINWTISKMNFKA